MIPVNCPCCEVPHGPHNTGCTYAADCPSEEADWAEVSSLRREVMLLNRKVEGLKQLDDISVRVNNQHVKIQAALRAEIARLVAEVERHRMTEQERRMSASAADFMSHPGIDPEPLEMSAEINALLGYLDRTTQKEVGRE